MSLILPRMLLVLPVIIRQLCQLCPLITLRPTQRLHIKEQNISPFCQTWFELRRILLLLRLLNPHLWFQIVINPFTPLKDIDCQIACPQVMLSLQMSLLPYLLLVSGLRLYSHHHLLHLLPNLLLTIITIHRQFGENQMQHMLLQYLPHVVLRDCLLLQLKTCCPEGQSFLNVVTFQLF